MSENLEKALWDAYGVGVAELEEAINDMLPGIANHVRDANLDPECAALYKPGMVIRDKGPVLASCRAGGVAATHRFSIYSNHMADLSEFEEGTNWGLCAARPESRFKVLDVYEFEGKTQITLLHLLDDERWRIFAHAEFELPGLDVEGIRERFRVRCGQEPIPELATEDWLGNCAYPVGMNPAGGLYAPDPKPAEAVWLVGDTGFRRFLGNVVFLAKGPGDDGEWLGAIPGETDSGGILAWPYVDCECGLSFRYLCHAAIEDDGWVVCDRDEGALSIVRAGALKDAIWCPTGIDPHAFENLTFSADECYAPSNNSVAKLRDAEFLDPIRHPCFPDDVQALLLKSDSKGAEGVWLRLCDLRDGVVYGRLLNEPVQNFGVHAGDVLPLSFREDGERGLEAAVLLDDL